MMKQAKEIKMEPISFRVDQKLIRAFESICTNQNTTKSEALRSLFVGHIHNLNQKQINVLSESNPVNKEANREIINGLEHNGITDDNTSVKSLHHE